MHPCTHTFTPFDAVHSRVHGFMMTTIWRVNIVIYTRRERFRGRRKILFGRTRVSPTLSFHRFYTLSDALCPHFTHTHARVHNINSICFRLNYFTTADAHAGIALTNDLFGNVTFSRPPVTRRHYNIIISGVTHE